MLYILNISQELKEWKITGNNKFNKLENSALSVKETDAAVPYYHTQVNFTITPTHPIATSVQFYNI